jgi:hypothetical protein
VQALEQTRKDAGGCALKLVRAAGGEGKSTLLLQVAVDLIRNGDWTVLWRENPDIALPVAGLTALDPARSWLIVGDAAENLWTPLDEAASRLNAAGCINVHFSPT